MTTDIILLLVSLTVFVAMIVLILYSIRRQQALHDAMQDDLSRALSELRRELGETILLALAYSHFRALRVFRPVLIWVAQGFAKLNDVIDWALVPLFAITNLTKHAIMTLFTKRKTA
mgnify:CR=1 FL=1